MRVLGIETSCDETASAVVEYQAPADFKVLSSVVASQIDIHKEFGGVVPEVAARSHLEVILPVIQKALSSAFEESRGSRFETSTSKAPGSRLQAHQFDPWAQIDGIAVTNGPGLLGALLIGVNTAKTLALLKKLPLIGVNHVHAHVIAAWLETKQDLHFPALGLIVSGGHTQLALFRTFTDYELLGQTQDDAVGEAYDKVAKILGLGYPGGPALAGTAEKGNQEAYVFPTPKLTGVYDFSFSGIKTAVLRHCQQLIGEDYTYPSYKVASRLSEKQIRDVAASFQRTANQYLLSSAEKAVQEYQPRSLIVAGGVAANQDLRTIFAKTFGESVTFPPLEYCTDNAAMVAALGAVHLSSNHRANPLKLESMPSLAM